MINTKVKVLHQCYFATLDPLGCKLLDSTYSKSLPFGRNFRKTEQQKNNDLGVQKASSESPLESHCLLRICLSIELF